MLALLTLIWVPSILIAFIIVMIKPSIVNKPINKNYGRWLIGAYGMAIIFSSFINLFLSMAITAPSVKGNSNTNNKVTVAKPKLETIEESKIERIPFNTVYKDDQTIPLGQEKTAQEGVDGSRTIIFEIIKTDGIETSKREKSNTVTKQATDKIILKGTYMAPVSTQSSTPAPTSSSAVASSSPAPTATTNESTVYYASCAAARSAGAAPILRGQPGYRSGLDRDNDGVACEN